MARHCTHFGDRRQLCWSGEDSSFLQSSAVRMRTQYTRCYWSSHPYWSTRSSIRHWFGYQLGNQARKWWFDRSSGLSGKARLIRSRLMRWQEVSGCGSKVGVVLLCLDGMDLSRVAESCSWWLRCWYKVSVIMWCYRCRQWIVKGTNCRRSHRLARFLSPTIDLWLTRTVGWRCS